MIPADILLVLILVLLLVVPFVVLAGLGARIAARRARLVEPRYPGNCKAFPPAEQRALPAAMGRACRLAWYRWKQKQEAGD